MNKRTKISSICVVLILSGCATDYNNQQYAEVQEKNANTQADADRLSEDADRLSEMNRQLQSSKVFQGGDQLPQNAKVGECYARILTPATYKTDTREVLQKPAAYRIEVTKPIYEMGTEHVLVKEASEVVEVIPAKYDWKVEKVLVSEAYEELKTIPAVFDTKTEQLMVKSAYTIWKKGRGPIEKVDNATGEIMCLVEVPAGYKTISSIVMVTPARTEKIVHPTVYKEVKKRILIEAPRIVKKTIPAEYKTIKVKKVLKPAQENRIEVPAVYQTISNRVKVSDSFLEWRSILCETNTTGDIVRNLQKALLNAGHNPGEIDGIMGSATMQAVNDYQKEKNLASGQLTIETLESLGVNYK